MSMSPSALARQLSSMLVLAVYMCTAKPLLDAALGCVVRERGVRNTPAWQTQPMQTCHNPSRLRALLSADSKPASAAVVLSPGPRPHLPAPQTVNMPRTKSTGSAGIVHGRQRSWFGVTTPLAKSAVSVSAGKLSGWKGSCVTEGRMRYSQDRRFCTRGAVNAVPLQGAVQRGGSGRWAW